MRPISLLVPASVAVVAVAVALVLSHGSGPSARSGSRATGSEKIVISNFNYSPASVTVKVGTTVIFTDEESVEHTATSNVEGLFATGTLNMGQSVRLKMNKVGSFSYHCSFHAFMHGTIRVVA